MAVHSILSLNLLLMIVFYSNSSPARLIDTGMGVHSTKIDDPDFYNHSTALGRRVKEVYKTYSPSEMALKSELPDDFAVFIDVAHQYILNRTGTDGRLNGDGFDFSREALPTKLIRLSFCFGIDPFQFVGLVDQESRFDGTARSPTKAFGFMQLTGVAVAEVSEQLGLLGPGYHGSSPVGAATVPEIWGSYISCYLGPNKQWRNLWDDEVVPKGKSAYMNDSIGEGRQWKFVTRSTTWFDKDFDRNLIYGTIYFKLLLGAYGGRYSAAKTAYNVSHASIYSTSIRRKYDVMRKLYRLIEANAADPGRRAGFTRVEFSMGSYKCAVPTDVDLVASADLPLEEQFDRNFSDWVDGGYCRPERIGI